ncbi:MAG: hypothetical protein Pg6C_06340 [Treponemataceae bacterium]|nr:MAG: hypothetical protein Pg6C_06340 [Treponemataceae bacterium]
MKKPRNSNFPERFFWILSASVMILFYALNILTPLIADDYSYSLGIHSVADIVRNPYNLWHGWSGRSVAHFLAQFWLLIGKPFFNLANTLVYCAFVLLTYFHITGTLRKFKPAVFFIINVFYWFLVPAWGQNFLWLVGSCNYLWTTTSILFFLAPFRKRQDKKAYRLNVPLSALFFIAGVLAGWSNENSGAAVLFLLIAYFAMKIINKEKVILFEITGTIGFLTGFALLVAAPGNYVRADVMKEMGIGHYNDALAVMLFKRFIVITIMFLKNYGAAVISAAAFFAFDLLYRQKRTLNIFSYFYALAAFAAAWSMMLAPDFPDRAFLIVTVFSGITLGNVLLKLEIQIPSIVKRNGMLLPVCIFLLFISPSFLRAVKNIADIHLRWQNRVEYILAEKEKGNLDVEVRGPIPAGDRHTALYGLLDIVDNENEWVNKSIAEYFGLRSIKRLNSDEPWPVILRW